MQAEHLCLASRKLQVQPALGAFWSAAFPASKEKGGKRIIKDNGSVGAVPAARTVSTQPPCATATSFSKTRRGKMLLSTPEHSQGQHRLGVPPALTPRHHGDRAEGPRATGLSPTSPHMSLGAQPTWGAAGLRSVSPCSPPHGQGLGSWTPAFTAQRNSSSFNGVM